MAYKFTINPSSLTGESFILANPILGIGKTIQMIQIVINSAFEGLAKTYFKTNKIKHAKHQQENFYDNVFSCLGISGLTQAFPDFLRQYYNLNGQYLAVSLTHWQATHNDIMLTAVEEALFLTEEEAQMWFKRLKSFWLDNNIVEMIYHDKYHWLFLPPDYLPTLSVPSPTQLSNRSLYKTLTTMDKTHQWQKFLTETQMFLSTQRLNTLQEGPSINAVWCWGGEAFQPQKNPRRTIWVDDDCLFKVLSNQSHRVCHIKEEMFLQSDDLICLRNPKVSQIEMVLDSIKHYDCTWHFCDLHFFYPTGFWHRLWRK